MFLPAFIPFELPDPAVTEAAGYNLRLGWRAVHPDLRSRDGYRYPFPGQWADAGGPILGHTDACPRAAGDGLCVAKTWRGAASGGIPATTVLLVGYDQADVYGEDADKVRVGAMLVLDVIDVAVLARQGRLAGADLTRADLTGADLTRANLTGANLTGAYLTRANLTGANLTRAYLTGAYLTGANLSRANLTGARANRFTVWPTGFNPAARGVVVS